MIFGLTKINIKHSVHFQIVEADCHLTFVMPQCSFPSHIIKSFLFFSNYNTLSNIFE